ncbi:MAG: hypothetical protein HIU93_00830 [Acidobacteria bacterium]|nr:hypothetical protein [Acidobacteriota bacterium]MBW4044158.1 hypothetical protein [Acidobacteriota bacterium]
MKATVIPSTTRDLTERLIALERCEADGETEPAFRVCDKLRRPLSMLMGTLGYRALISRALTLAQRESKLLTSVRVKEDGALECLNSEAFPAAALLAKQLIALLLSFVGEAVTLRLLDDVWPTLRGSETTRGDLNDSKRQSYDQ